MSRPLASTRISGLHSNPTHRSAPIDALVSPGTNSVASPSLAATTRASSPRSDTPSTRNRDPRTGESPIDSSQITAHRITRTRPAAVGPGRRCAALRCVALRGPGPHSAYTEKEPHYRASSSFPPLSLGVTGRCPAILPPPRPSHSALPACLPTLFTSSYSLPLPGKGAPAFTSSLTPHRIIPRNTFLSPLPTQPAADPGATLSLPCHKPLGPHTFQPGHHAR